MRRSVNVIALAALAGSLGCGGDGAGTSDGPRAGGDALDGGGPASDSSAGGSAADGASGGATIPLAMMPTAAAAAICEKIASCCTDAEREQSVLPPDRAGCEATLRESHAGEARLIEGSLAANRASYDGAALAGCIARLRDQSCAEARLAAGQSMLFSCTAMVVAKVPLGAACRDSLECAGGYCADSSGQRDGKCAGPLRKDGVACDNDGQCESRFCDPFDDRCAPAEPERLCE